MFFFFFFSPNVVSILFVLVLLPFSVYTGGQVGYDTWCDLIASSCRGNTIGNMRGAAFDSKHRNFLKRSSHMENVGRGVVDGGLSNMRPGHYTNTALFQSGYSRFNREDMFEPNQNEAQRQGIVGKKVYDEKQKEWIDRYVDRYLFSLYIHLSFIFNRTC